MSNPIVQHTSDLAAAALLIAKEEYPDLDISGYLQRIDTFASEVQTRLPSEAAAIDILTELNTYLFEDLGFSGNPDDYYDPRNSYLNQVMDRKLGIPITLSILYIETGRRLGLDLQGIAFPGHFLVRFNVGNGVIVLDPYYGGISLSEEDLIERLQETADEDSVFTLEELLSPASNTAILQRMLRNLRGLYLYDKQHEKALRSADHIVTLTPHSAEEYLIRGLIYKEMECFRPALDDYQRYLQLAPEATDNDAVRADIIRLQAAVQHLH